MRSPRVADPRICSIDAAMKVIGEKWSLLAIREISFGQHRFDDIVYNTGAPRDVLTQRLRTLEEAGVIRREIYQDNPARYEYHLADAGMALFAVLEVIRDWGDRFVRDDPENVVAFTHECGSQVRPEVRCGTCGELIELDSLQGDRDVHRSQVVAAG